MADLILRISDTAFPALHARKQPSVQALDGRQVPYDLIYDDARKAAVFTVGQNIALSIFDVPESLRASVSSEYRRLSSYLPDIAA